MNEAMRYVGTYRVSDQTNVVDVSRCDLDEAESNGNYFQLSGFDPDNCSSEEGAIIYNSLVHAAIVIMPEKKRNVVAQTLTELFHLSPAEDDFITWDEWKQWNIKGLG